MRVAGIGFRKEAGVDSLLAALNASGGAVGVTHLATVDAKADADCMRALADRLEVPVIAVPKIALAGVDVSTHSEKSVAMYGTGSVSEAAALCAAGVGAKLVAARALADDKMATCAIAEGEG